MKKFALLCSSFAVVASALAATPELNENLPKVNVSKAEPVQKVATAVKGEKIRVVENKAANKVISKAAGLTVGYNEPEGLFCLGMNEELRGFADLSMRKGPAYKPLTWINTSVGATDFEWAFTTFGDNGAGTGFSSDIDLVRSEVFSSVDAPVLTGVSATGEEATFQMDPEFYAYYYGGDCDYDFASGTLSLGMTTYMHDTPDAGYSHFGCMAYAPGEADYNATTGLDNVFTDAEPDGYGLTNVEFVGYANVFHAPLSAYFISKMWCWIYVQAKKNTVVDMTLYKIDEEGYITDEVLAAGSANLTASSSPQSKVISFDLYALDEDGLETEDLVVIDCPFVAVMKFNKDDLVTANAIAGAGAEYPASEKSPYSRHAMIVLNADGEQQFMYSPFSYFTDATMTTLVSITDWAWMVDAVFPFALTADGEDTKDAPVEGGKVDFGITCLYNIASLGWSLEEGCDWIDLDNSTVDSQNQVVSFAVNPLPEGVESRSTTITMECPATPLTLTINQGSGNAVEVVKAENGAVYYDLAGRRVVNPEKGVYVKVNGNKSEKVVL